MIRRVWARLRQEDTIQGLENDVNFWEQEFNEMARERDIQRERAVIAERKIKRVMEALNGN